MFSDSVCPTFRKVLVASVFGVCVFLIPNGVHAATSNSATVLWDANQEPDLAGYRVYHGNTPGNYGSPQNAGMTPTYQYANLESNKTYYFSVTAYDTSGNESPPSLEVSKAIPGPDSSLSISISGSGTVSSSPAGVSCASGSCSGTFPQGSSVTLTAIPASGSTFSGWSGGGCSGAGSCVVTLSTSAVSVSATFAVIPPPARSLNVTLAGGGSGTVSSSPAGVSCASGSCSGTFPQGSSVTLTAIPASGSTFSGWSGGGCSGAGSCVVTLSTSAVSVSATFAVIPPPARSLNVTLAGGGSGTVSSSPAGVSCASGSCSGTFPQGSSVTLTAIPASGSTFSGWSGGGCSGAGSCVVTLSTSAVSVSATFAVIPPPARSLNVTLAGGGSGTVSSSPAGVSCASGSCSGTFPQGSSVTLTAIPASGSTFSGWSGGGCSGAGSCVVTLSTSAVSVSATFAVIPPPPPKPNLPLGVNFQPTASQVPTNFKKDDGSVFNATRGYGWNQLLNGTEQNATADQTLDTFVSTANLNPGTWNFAIPNGIYYVTMVLGDPKNAQGPHWVSVEDFQLVKQVNTAEGEYLVIVDYSVEVKDSTLSLTLGNSGQGQTTLNYLAINEKPNLSNTSQTLVQSFGTTLVTSVLNPGEATKVNPVVLVQKYQEEKELQEKAVAQKIKEEEAAALAQVQVNEQKEQEVAKLNQIIKQQEAAARVQDRMEKEKEQEEAKLNGIKENMSSIRDSGGTVTLRNLLEGS